MAAPGATPLVIPNPVELSNSFSQIAKQMEPTRGQYLDHLSAQGSGAQPQAATAAASRCSRPTKTIRSDSDPQDDFLYRFFGGNPFGGGGRRRWRPQELRAGIGRGGR